MNMKQYNLVVDTSDFWSNGSLLLINQFLLFQYSLAIFSVSITALVLTLAQKIPTLTHFLKHV